MGGPACRIWSIEDNNSSGTIGRCSEVLVISHNAPVNRVRFHPTAQNTLCTSSVDGTVRVFDIRAGVERSVGRIDTNGKSANYIDWNPNSSGGGSASFLSVTEREAVRVYDTRKLSNASRGSTNTKSTSTAVHTFQIPNVDLDCCIFSPLGNHLVAATATKGEMPSDLRIWEWKQGSEAFDKSRKDETQFKVPAHSGPVFTMAFSPDGKRLATGGADSIVGIWNIATMCCTATIDRRVKRICGVSFSKDGKWLAHCSAEDGIDIAESDTGEQAGMVQLQEKPGMSGYGGADEVAFHPSSGHSGHILACAKGPTSPSGNSSAVVVKCRLSS